MEDSREEIDLLLGLMDREGESGSPTARPAGMVDESTPVDSAARS